MIDHGCTMKQTTSKIDPMRRTASNLTMKSQRSKSEKPWFRIENSFVDENNSDEEKAVIYIYDEIGESWWGESTSAVDFVRQISALKVKQIDLHLNTPGGDIFDGVAIYNALKSHPAEVTVIVDALAASAGSFIAQAGDKVIMTRAATMMIHDGSAMVWGTATDMRKTADVLDQLSNTVADIYTARAGQSVEFWRNLMIEEVWFNANEAVEAGLADEVGEETKEEDEETAQNKWDLSIFNYAGRSAAPSPIVVRERIVNQLREAHMPGRKNQSETSPEGGTGNEPPVEDDNNPETEVGAEGDTESGTDSGTQEPPATPPPPSNSAAANAAATSPVKFTFGDQVVTDPATAQQLINGLIEYQITMKTTGRKDFVKRLHDEKKIAGPQVKVTEDFALSLSDEGFEAWKATWDGAPALSILQSHGPGDGGEESSPEAQELQTAKEIVARHKAGNMTNEQIKETASYKRILESEPDFKL